MSVRRSLSDPEVIKEFEHPDSRVKGSELMADDRGRTRPRSKKSVRGAAVARPTPPREVEARKFSRELADFLRLGRAHNQYRKLILVAPPQFLGLLRDAIDGPVALSIEATVAKNFCGQHPATIADAVREIMS
jgi:protein required for attachment to host cells